MTTKAYSIDPEIMCIEEETRRRVGGEIVFIFYCTNKNICLIIEEIIKDNISKGLYNKRHSVFSHING